MNDMPGDRARHRLANMFFADRSWGLRVLSAFSFNSFDRVRWWRQRALLSRSAGIAAAACSKPDAGRECLHDRRRGTYQHDKVSLLLFVVVVLH